MFPLLTNIFLGKSTDLCEIMNRHGSDKGSGHHNYTKVYDILFSPMRTKNLNVLEIGIGTVNPNLPSSMAGKPGGYNPGSSLRGLEEYFPNAQIFGADIDRDILFNTERISTFYLDQTSDNSLNELINRNIKFDIIIDDGWHYFPNNFQVMTRLYTLLNPGGIYVIEDIMHNQYDRTCENSQFIQTITAAGDTYQYLQIPNPQNIHDNNLFIVLKK